MSEQRLDLENTASKLRKIIGDMTTTMQNQFKEKFELINKNFNEVFTELFNGGKAELILENEENILECGIDIRVQPPGKKLQNMMLLSGGEKAMAMYIPLFAGINAKFNSAKKDAPRIVALDEAFAGVDDINIEDSFRILDELNLDYVLTSQILWGDYSTIKSLSICELHHLSSSDVVSVLRYKWDGHKRLLITDESEYQN